MKILLATPLYPPDVAQPAPYTKELASRLAQAGHDVVAVVYGRLPEPVAGVRIVGVDKRQALPARLWDFYRTLSREAREADIIVAENGPSVELPLLFVRGRIVLHVGDRAALGKGGVLAALARWRAAHVVTDMPPERPEILPFVPRPDAALAHYEQSWTTHLAHLQTLFIHGA
jgi:hypothetical protein